MSFTEFFAMLQPHFVALDRVLEEQLSEFEAEIRELALYCVDTGGKRIRPALVFFSGWKAPDTVPAPLVQLAAVVEMVHLATLVHDDIMDGASVRRRRPTASRKYGPETAVLLGDALFAHALSLAAQFPTTEVCRHVAVSTRKVCAGEIMQTLAGSEAVRDMSYYRRVIDLKTAELFFVSCFLGARLAGAHEKTALAVGEFGRKLGTAYQIYDDLADFFGSELKFGKTLGTDLASGKITLPLLVLMDALPPSEAGALRAELTRGEGLDLAGLVDQMRRHEVFPKAIAVMRRELAEGLRHLERVQTPAVPMLQKLTVLLDEQASQLCR